MATAVGYVGGIHVMVINLDEEKVYPVTPHDALEAAERCIAAAEAGRPDYTIMIPTSDGDAFAYSGDPAAFRMMSQDLRIAAEKANHATRFGSRSA